MAGKGNPKGVGKPKGATSHKAKAIQDMVTEALNNYSYGGGVGWLEKLRDTEPTAFATLVGKLMPKDVTVSGGEKPVETIQSLKESDKKLLEQFMLTKGVKL